MEEPAAEPVAPALKRLSLRLDNGTVIRRDADAPEAVVLKPDEAWQSGLLKEEHLLRIQALLCEQHSKLPEEAPPKSISTGSKRSSDSMVEVAQYGSVQPDPAKRARITEDTGYGAAALVPAPAAAPVPAPAAAGASPPREWVGICKAMVNFLLTKVLATKLQYDVFFYPVDTIRDVPDYLDFVKSPISFSEIMQRLDASAYSSPVDFYNDVILLCDNCYAFNAVGKSMWDWAEVGLRMEAAFLRAWGNTQWAGLVAPRQARQLPAWTAQKPPKKPRGGAAAAASRAPRSYPLGAPRGRGGGRRGRPPGSLGARSKSINHLAVQQQLPHDKMDALAAALGDPSVLEAKMDGVVAILQATNELPTNEDGEVELDLSIISPQVIWQLYEHCIGPPGVAAAHGVGVGAAAAAPRPAASAGRYTAADGNANEDSDWNPDEEEDE